jgi:hypothetical protein
MGCETRMVLFLFNPLSMKAPDAEVLPKYSLKIETGGTF